jgi:hypothetical protein
MRLYSGKVATVASEVVHALRSAGDIDTPSPKEVERDIVAVLESYVKTELDAAAAAKDHIQARGLPTSDFARLKRLYAEQKGIKIGDETLDFLLDQVVEMLFHSSNVDEVFAEDHDLRRKMAPIFKKHMAADDDLEREVRGQLKHVKEGTSLWEVEYQRVMADIKRRKGLS